MKRIFWLITAAILASTPAHAQRGGELEFVKLGRWTIVSQPSARRCEMRLAPTAAGTLVLSKARGSPGALELRGARGSRSSFGQVTWAFDDTALQGQKFGSGTYGLISNTSGVEAQFRRARYLTISDGGQMIGRFALDSSSSGFRLLNQCADQWRPGFRALGSRIASAQPFNGNSARQNLAANTPRPQQSEQPRVSPQSTLRSSAPPTIQRSAPANAASATSRVSGPLPPNRSVKPLNRASWIDADDVGRFNPPRNGFETLRFTLLVNQSGRVEECAVNASSGSRSVDKRVCRTMQQRARFEPATDANGNAIQGSYSSNVRFAEGG
ncbi:MAG: energy transducer TonB [Erythrobacter sp.]